MAQYNLTFESDDGKPIAFPFNQQPCFIPGQKLLIHFISSNKTWYGFIFQGRADFYCRTTKNLNINTLNALKFYSELSGACCKLDGTCEITENGLCSGYFVGVGTTCGANNICKQNVGACCVTSVIDGKNNNYCLDNITPHSCFSLNSSGVESIFSGFGKTCNDIDCNNALSKNGACCDGKGNCKELTETDCITSGRSFLGKTTSCSINSPCSSGSGACCYPSGICGKSTSDICFSSGGFYHGNGTDCSGITCNSYNNCCSFLSSSIKPGDMLGGGIVVGLYDPKNSKLFGANKAFSRHGFTYSHINGETLAHYYKSEYDYNGYGFEGEDCATLKNENSDLYYIIVSLYPASIDKDGNLVNPTEELPHQDIFSWYSGGNAWGPLCNLNSYSYEELTFLEQSYEELYLKYGEGYYGITGESFETLRQSTFPLCNSSRINGLDPIARLFTRNIKTINGLWNRNWGIYNTIRMISADNAYYKKLSSKYFNYEDFYIDDNWNSVYALKLFDNDLYTNSFSLDQNPVQLSDWYLPSHDELAFIAANTITDSSNSYYGFDLNSKLLENSGVPLYGWHWSSTGTFDETDNLEGIYVSDKPKHGSMAWALYFNQNGESSDYYATKKNRNEKLKIRPIRMIRCDGRVPDSNNDSYKLWKTPILLRNSL